VANSYELLLKIGGQLESSFGKSINGATKSLSGIGKTVSTVKNVVVGALGAAGVGLSLKTLIDTGGEAEQTTAQMNAVLKSTKGIAGMSAKQLNSLALAQQGVTTYGEDTTKQAENMLLTFTNIRSNVFPQTLQATEDMATAMKMDASSAAKTLGKALNDPATGLSKLTKQGVTFTASQKKQIQAMQKAGNVAGAQSIMIQEIEREFGGSAKAAGQTVTGQMAIIKNTLHSTMEQIGLMILPAIRALLPQVTGLLKQAAANLAAHQEDIKRGLAQFAAGATTIFTKVIPAISAAVSKIVPVISGAVKGVSPILKDVFNFVISHKDLVIGAIAGIGAASGAMKVGKIFTEFTRGMKAIGPTTTLVGKLGFALTDLKTSPTILKGLANGFKDIFGLDPKLLLITAAIAAIAAAAYLIIKNWGPISSFFKKLWGDVTGAFNSAKAKIGNFFSGIGTGFSQFLTGIKSLLGKIKSFFTAAFSPIVKSVMGPFNQLKTGISNILNGLKNIFQGAWTVIKNIVLAPVLVICDIISGNFGKIPSDMAKIWKNVGNGIKQVWNGIKQYFTGILQAMAGVFGTVGNVFLTIGNSIGSTLGSLFTNLWNGIKNTAVNVWNGLLSFFSSLPQRFTSFMSGVGNAIIHGFDSAVTFIKNLPAEMLQWGKDMINGLINGIKGAIGGVQQAAGNVAKTIRSFLHFSVPDTGPLKDAASYGPDFIKLYSSGITKSIPNLKKAAQAAAGGVNAGINKPISKITPFPGAAGGGNVSGGQPASFNVKYEQKIIIQGNASKDDVTQAMDEGQRKFDERMRKWRSEVKRRTGKDPIPA
jgi:phage-related protein